MVLSVLFYKNFKVFLLHGDFSYNSYLLLNLTDFARSITGAHVTLFTVLLNYFIVIGSFEFILLNFLMLFAVFLYYFIPKTSRILKFFKILIRINKMSGLSTLSFFILRLSRQTVQLLRPCTTGVFYK